MPVQRKVFRIEQTNAIGAPADAASPSQPNDILDELRALRDLIQNQARSLRHIEAGVMESDELRQLKDETDSIHRVIAHTKQEVATLHAGTFSDGKPRATRELDAVADGTERATQQILDAAEVIEEAAKLLSASVKQGQEQALAQDIQDHALRIFEACNFQDLSGQRITKVLATLQFVEDRIARMMEIWGGAEAFREFTAAALAERQREAQLLNGPKLDGDAGHASQDDVDAIFKSA